MAGQRSQEFGVTISAENIGGIDETTVDLSPGVNVLSGRNATNRTSFLQAIMAGLGSDNISMKADAESAAVTVEIGADQYHRELRRTNGSFTSTGDLYPGDTELADLFAFLLESNEARQAVTTQGNLREIIMRPVDTADIQAEIADLKSEKRELDAKIEDVEGEKGRLPALGERREELAAEIAELRDQLETKEAEIEESNANLTARDAEEEKLESLRERRSDLEDVRYELETEREAIQSLKQDRSQARAELEETSEANTERIDELEARIDELRERRRRVDDEITSLQSTIQFNEEMLDGGRSDIPQEWGTDGDGAVTDQLLSGEEITCWTCGSDVERKQIEETLGQLKTMRERKQGEKQDVTEELESYRSEKRSLSEQRDRREAQKRRLQRVETELEESKDRRKSLQRRRAELEESVQELEAELEQLQSEEFEQIVELHRDANEIEYELGRLENDRQDVVSEIERIERKLEAVSKYATRREEINERLSELRTYVERLEKEAVESFNEHMTDVLDVLAYDNLERIWIERLQRETRDGRRKSIESFFELHVVRSQPSGVTYEDTLDHLSESEREVTGLVFGLAGYLVHDVYEEVPFMLLDSLEAIDSDRIARLVEYFSDYPRYLVVALLTEDAEALPAECTRIERI